MKLIEFMLRRPLLLNLLTVFILAVGVMQMSKLRREAWPAVNFDIVMVTTIYPGASPKEVELYVTKPIEEEVIDVVGIKDVQSSSSEGFSLLTITLDPDRTDRQKEKTTAEIRQAVDRVSGLPDDLLDPPKVEEVDSARFPVIEVAVSADVPYDELYEFADRLAERYESIPDVGTVNRMGLNEPEVWVEINPKKLAEYDLSLGAVLGILRARNLNLPGGALKLPSGELLVRTVGELTTVEDIADTVLRYNHAGIQVLLSDVATVKDTFEESQRVYRTNGKPSINLMVLTKENGDIIDLVDEVLTAGQEFQESYGDDRFELSPVNDFSVYVRNRLGVLTNNAVVGIGLVLVVLLLFLSKGVAFATALGLPIAFMGAMIYMGYTGGTINLLSMFGMVLVLGMLVDDAIIVAENIWQHYERGESAWDATVKGTAEVIYPVSATILTSIAAFSPLLMMSGIFGKFMKAMPEIVIVALIASLIESMLILPSHVYDMLKIRERFVKRKKKQTAKTDPSGHVFGPLVRAYGWTLGLSLRLRYLFILLIFATAGFSGWWAKEKMNFVLFPQEGIEAFFVRADLERGTSLEETTERFKAIENFIATLPDNELMDQVTNIGIQQNDPNDPFTQRGSHLGQIAVYLTPEIERTRTAADIVNSLRAQTELLKAKHDLTRLDFDFQQAGPPVGKPVAIRIEGDDLDLLDAVALEVMAELEQTPHVSDIGKNYNYGKDELQVIVDEQAAARALISVDQVAMHVRAALAGQIAGHVTRDDERIAVRVLYEDDGRKRMDIFRQLQIPNALGNLVPLREIATLKQVPGIVQILHYDERRAITVSANIDETKTSSQRINAEIEPFLDSIRVKQPAITLSAGGEFEDTQESLQSLMEAFAIAMALIFLILATQFQSVTQPFVVMAAIPFGVVGVIWAFYAHSLPLSFLGFIGVIGLSGVVVNDSIVLVDFLNKARQQGMTAFEAAVYSGMRRFRAVWLTTFTTVCGLVPMVYGIGGMDKFLRPAAVALGYGLLFGTVLVLFFVPCLYLIHVDVGRVFRWVFRLGRKPETQEI